MIDVRALYSSVVGLGSRGRLLPCLADATSAPSRVNVPGRHLRVCIRLADTRGDGSSLHAPPVRVVAFSG